MSWLHRLVLWFYCLHLAICLYGDSSCCPAYSDDNDFRNMMLMKDGEHLIISGLNSVYNLNATNFQLLNKDNTSTTDSDDKISIMFYTEIDGKKCITTCSSTREYCDVRETENIQMILRQLRPPMKFEGVAAIMVNYTKPRNRQEEFLFIGCPHIRDQEYLADRCTEPGIAWYLNSGETKSRQWYGFKSYHDTNILTEKYLEAFIVDNFRIFFSLQRVKSSNERRSRIAQVCQYYSPLFSSYTTPLTYADMPLECADLKVIQTVKKVSVGDELFFIVAFSETTKSAVCVYTMESIKKKFVENIKLCYRGKYPDESEGYIKFPGYSAPCTAELIYNETQNDDYYLCNLDQLQMFQQVIGNLSMKANPAIQYPKSIKAITVTVKDSKIIALLGMTNGDIEKAVVYPIPSAVQQPRVYNVGYGIKRDMYTSLDEKHIFVLTQRQVFKLPVESCSEFSTCDNCTGSKDPHCGWCFLENRCSIKEKCITSIWVSAFDDGKCPYVRSIIPYVMSDKTIEEVTMNVSRSLNDVAVTCTFHSDDIADFQDRVSATVFENGWQVKCKPRNTLPIKNGIKGFRVITVSISTNLSDALIMSTQLTMYRCESFDRCFTCTSRNWTCKWCTYGSQCLNDDKPCDTMDIEVPAGKCPFVHNYIVEPDDIGVRDSNRTVYLSRDKDYEINITGLYFPEPRQGSVSYMCRIVLSGNRTLWINGTTFSKESDNSVVCNISKEKMSVIALQDGKLESNVEVMWGESPLHGRTMPIIIYKCEYLVSPLLNCGQCKSFEIYQSYFHCKWCVIMCVDSEKTCNDMSSDCGDPEIMRVSPLSAHINATTLIEIEGYNLGSVYIDTIDSVSIAGLPCESVESAYVPGTKMSCKLSPSYGDKLKGTVNISLRNNATGYYPKPFFFRNPIVTSIEPDLGPQSGGTMVTLYGHYLETGRDRNITICGKTCTIFVKVQQTIICKTSSCGHIKSDELADVKVKIDGAYVVLRENVSYRYVVDPIITDIYPKKSFQSGGRTLTIHGTRLYAIQKPIIYAVVGDKGVGSVACERDDTLGVIFCPSPMFIEGETRRKGNTDPIQAKLGFKMDDVSSVTAENLPDDIAILLYYPDPVLENFTEEYQKLQGHLTIKGRRLNVAADEEDVIVMIGCVNCNVTSVTYNAIYCEPPAQKPVCDSPVGHRLKVQVKVGFLQSIVGFLEYDSSEDDNVVIDTSIIGGVAGFLVLCLLIALIVVGVMWYKHKKMKKVKAGLEYKMEKLEARKRM